MNPLRQRKSRIFPAYLMEKNSQNCQPLSVPHHLEEEPQPQDLDLFSQLPDDILVYILSTMSFKKAAQTSVISHRWLKLWTHVPCLLFESTKDQRRPCHMTLRKKNMAVFVNLVNYVLRSRKRSSLRVFSIFFELDKSYQNKIDKWLKYAFEMGVQRLDLDFSKYGFLASIAENCYHFPNQLLHQTTKFGVQPDAKVGFSCLRELFLNSVCISGEAIEGLLLNCPLLEDLRLLSTGGMTNLVVSGPSLLLKHLELSCCYPAKSITISNTNIVFLKISLMIRGRVLLKDLPMLTELWIKGYYPEKSIYFATFSCLMPQLTHLTLENLYSETIMDLYKFPELPKLRRLVLVVTLCGDMSLIGLTSLIDSCPRLVDFAVRLFPAENRTSYRERPNPVVATEESLNKVKVFEMYGYHGRTNESEMIMFFIENAVALEKIVIDPHVGNDVSTWRNVGPIEHKGTEDSRRQAIEKFGSVVPRHVELVIY